MYRALLTLLTSALLLALAGSNAWAGDAVDGATEESATQPLSPSGFLPAETLARIYSLPEDQLQAEIALLETNEASVGNSIRALRRMLSYQERNRSKAPKDGGLTANGCFVTWPAHRESAFLDRDSLSTALDTFFRRANHVLLAEVQETRPGFMGSAAMTLVTIRVIEEISPPPESLSLPKTLAYADRRFELSLGDRLICSERPGFHMPQTGDLLLVLTEPYEAPTNFPGGIRATNVFPVEEGMILPQPYPQLAFDKSITIGQLRDILTSGEVPSSSHD